jgi:hypothetical protein
MAHRIKASIGSSWTKFLAAITADGGENTFDYNLGVANVTTFRASIQYFRGNNDLREACEPELQVKEAQPRYAK